MPIVLDPRWPRERLARVGRDISFEWLTANRLPLPDRVYLDREAANAARRQSDPRSKPLLRPEWLGVYQRPWPGGWSAVAVSVSDCPRRQTLRLNGLKAIRQAPGSFTDFSPLGVFCHEVGHHVDYSLHPKGYSRRNGFTDVIDNEEEVSGIEHNVHEAFAEAIRLFVTNPDLLRRGRPDRYEYLTKGMGLKPLHSGSWRLVLARAGKGVRGAVEKWLV